MITTTTPAMLDPSLRRYHVELDVSVALDMEIAAASEDEARHIARDHLLKSLGFLQDNPAVVIDTLAIPVGENGN